MVNDLVVVITGAAGRIGSALAKGVLSSGGKVILTDVNEANLDKLKESLGSENALTIVADSGLPNEVDHCIREGLQRFNRIPEFGEVLKAPIDRSEPHIGNLVQRF